MEGLSKLANVEYIDRVNRVLDHIHGHLDQSLKLEEVASVARFSPYHFHRIFKASTGETLKAYVQRVRLERALYLLSHSESVSLTEVALACGFASSSDFSRSFKRQYGLPPSTFDLEAFRRSRRARLQETLPPEGRHLLDRLPAGENPDGFEAVLRPLPPRRVAYLRVSRPFEEGRVTGAAERLVAWAEARGLAEGQWLGYMWDDPELVELEKCRYDVAVEVPLELRAAEIGGAGEVGLKDFPAMTVAEVEVAGPIDLEQRAIDWMYHTWLPQSGFVPDHQPAFEAWAGRPFGDGESHFELRFQLAVTDATTAL